MSVHSPCEARSREFQKRPKTLFMFTPGILYVSAILAFYQLNVHSMSGLIFESSQVRTSPKANRLFLKRTAAAAGELT